jgi:CPA1 family monovalent cation:H+ antiporter
VPERDIILGMTYVVVVFSVFVQGLTIGPLARRWLSKARLAPSSAEVGSQSP